MTFLQTTSLWTAKPANTTTTTNMTDCKKVKFPTFQPRASAGERTGEAYPIFQNRPNPFALGGSVQGSETSVFVPKFKKLDSPKYEVQPKYLEFAKLSSESSPTGEECWWPCLAFSSFSEMMSIIDELPPDFSDLKVQLALEYFEHIGCCGSEHDAELTPLLRLGENKASFYAPLQDQHGSNEERRISFSNRLFMPMLVDIKMKTENDNGTNAPLKRALDDALAILRQYQVRTQQKRSTTAVSTQVQNNMSEATTTAVVPFQALKQPPNAASTASRTLQQPSQHDVAPRLKAQNMSVENSRELKIDSPPPEDGDDDPRPSGHRSTVSNKRKRENKEKTTSTPQKNVNKESVTSDTSDDVTEHTHDTSDEAKKPKRRGRPPKIAKNKKVKSPDQETPSLERQKKDDTDSSPKKGGKQKLEKASNRPSETVKGKHTYKRKSSDEASTVSEGQNKRSLRARNSDTEANEPKKKKVRMGPSKSSTQTLETKQETDQGLSKRKDMIASKDSGSNESTTITKKKRGRKSKSNKPEEQEQGETVTSIDDSKSDKTSTSSDTVKKGGRQRKTSKGQEDPGTVGTERETKPNEITNRSDKAFKAAEKSEANSPINQKQAKSAAISKTTNASKIVHKAKKGKRVYTPIPEWDEVRPILEELGHTFNDGLFCRPYGDPKTNKNAIENEHYFHDELLFRRFLRSHGIDYIGEPPEGDKIYILNDWVRYSIIPSITLQKTIPIPKMGIPKAFKYLKCTGLKHVNELQVGYQIPGEDGIFTDAEVWRHFALKGLPDHPVIKALDDEERLDLWVRIAENSPFEQLFVEAKDPTKENQKQVDKVSKKAQRPSQSYVHNSGSHTSVETASSSSSLGNSVEKRIETTGKTLSDETHEDENLVAVKLSFDCEINNDSKDERKTFPPSEDNKSDEKNISKGKEGKSSNDTSIAATSVPVEKVIQNAHKVPDNQTKGSRKNSLKIGDFNFFDGAGKEAVLSGSTVRAMLQSCVDALKIGSMENMIITGKRVESISNIIRFLELAIKSKGRDGPENGPAYLHVCGAPGSGKSMGVKNCCQKALEWSRSHSETWEKEPQITYMNASHLQNYSKDIALQKTLEKMGLPSWNKIDVVESGDEAKRAAIVLVLDEIDLLVSETSASVLTEEYLKTLIKWSADKSKNFVLIGISNSVGTNKKSRKLVNLGMAPKNKIVFTTYNKQELIQIAVSRIGRSVVDPKVVEFIASKVAATSGDARAFIGLLAQAVETCTEKLADETLDSNPTGPVVKLPHAMMVLRSKNTKYREIIDSLPSYEKYTLVCGVHLSRVLNGEAVPLSTLKSCSMEAFGLDPITSDNHISLEDFKGIIERLSDSGLLNLVDRDSKALATEPMASLMNFPVRFGLQLEDVESALEETVLKEPFYQRIVDRIKSIKL